MNVINSTILRARLAAHQWLCVVLTGLLVMLIFGIAIADDSGGEHP